MYKNTRILEINPCRVIVDMPYSQLHLGDGAPGLAKVIAVIGLTPDELYNRTGITFELSSDDLDYMKAAIIKTDSGRQVGLRSYLHAPDQTGTTLIVAENTNDTSAALLEALEAIGLSENDVVSFHPDIR